MTPSNNLVGDLREAPQLESLRAAKPRRPSVRFSDIWKAPLHDFPIRDEILYQYLPLASHHTILELGPGTGFTAYRLARQARELTLLDVAEDALADVRAQVGDLPNVRFVCADVTRPGLRDIVGQEFDAAFGLDVFEYLVDPGMCLRNLAAVLRPGGELFLTYPNVPPPVGDGVTYFSSLSDLEVLLAEAGFRDWQIFAVRLRPYAAAIYGLLHELPLRIYRRVRAGDRQARPQTYQATWAFQHRQQLLRYKVPLHLFWGLVALGLRLGGDVFAPELVTDGILDRQLVIRARR